MKIKQNILQNLIEEYYTVDEVKELKTEFEKEVEILEGLDPIGSPRATIEALDAMVSEITDTEDFMQVLRLALSEVS